MYSIKKGRAPHGARGLKQFLWYKQLVLLCCRAPHGARGLKRYQRPGYQRIILGRAPHGARGLKHSSEHAGVLPYRMSRPARGAWIETNRVSAWTDQASGRAPHGARGLKLYFPLKQNHKL